MPPASSALKVVAHGLKGRPDETQYEDHVVRDATMALETPAGIEDVALRNAMNEVTRQAYIKDCEVGLRRWNRQIERAGFDFRLSLPSPRFRRSIGSWADAFVAPEQDETLVCRCEETTAGDIRRAVALGCPGPNQMKAFVRCGMGPCQGRMCGLTVTELMAAERNVSPGEIGYYRIRPPIKPLALGELAALDLGPAPD